jgi:hypothetical protein
VSQSAIIPLQVVLDQTIKGDATVSNLLGGDQVYSLRVPEDDSVFAGGKRGYIVLGQSSEVPRPNFDGPVRSGDDGTETMTVWTNDPSKYMAAFLAGELKRLFNYTDLVVAGRQFCYGQFTIVVVDLDPSGKYSFATCRYEVLTYAR